MEIANKIENLLPNYNCGSCGYNTCKSFAKSIAENNNNIEKCPLLNQHRFHDNKQKIHSLLNSEYKITNNCSNCISGVLDNYVADIVLHPLPNEKTCKETIMPTSIVKVCVDDIIEYRPLGCPIVHFAKILEINGMLLTVSMIGPEFQPQSTNIGLCMVIAFEGTYSGKQVRVGETVRFLPHHCMMQKIHSGVVINIENNKIRLEGIDLKVWSLPETNIFN